MEKLFDVLVDINSSFSVTGNYGTVNMINFTGRVEGPYFNGVVLGTGTDTQKAKKNSEAVLSARYMLEGKDYTGAPCRIFIENNGSFSNGFIPNFVTDSKALSRFETSKLIAEIEDREGGVKVSILSQL